MSKLKEFNKPALNKLRQIVKGREADMSEVYTKNQKISYKDGGEIKSGKYFYDTRYDKPFRVISVDGNKVGIQYIDLKTKETEDIKTVDKDDFIYKVKNGAWNEYQQPFEYEQGGEISELMQDSIM